MLVQLLRLLSDSRVVATTWEIAQKLGVSEELVRQMIDQAVVLGYLALLEPGCSNAPCHVCRERGSCLMGSTARLWTLTDKGERLLAERSALEKPEARAG